MHYYYQYNLQVCIDQGGSNTMEEEFCSLVAPIICSYPVFSIFYSFLHLLLLHSDDGGDVGLGALWAALEPHYPVRGAAEHIGDPGPFSKVHQCGDWVSMTTFVHAPHTAAESTLNHLCLWKAVEGSSLL